MLRPGKSPSSKLLSYTVCSHVNDMVEIVKYTCRSVILIGSSYIVNPKCRVQLVIDYTGHMHNMEAIICIHVGNWFI